MAENVKMPNRKKNVITAIIVIVLAIAAIGGTVAFVTTRGTASAAEVNEIEATSSNPGESQAPNKSEENEGGVSNDNPVIPGGDNGENGTIDETPANNEETANNNNTENNNNQAGNQNGTGRQNNTRREEELREVEIIDYETTIVERGTDGRYLSWAIAGVKSGIGYASKINARSNPNGIEVTKVGETTTGKNLVSPGEEITYTITVTSNKAITSGIEIMDRIPEQTIYVDNSIDSNGVTVNANGKTETNVSKVVAVKWETNITEFNNETGKYETKVSFKVKVNENAKGKITNTAIANGEETIIPAENSVVTSSKTSEVYRNNEIIEGPAKVGDKIVYTISVTNTGDVAGEAVLKDESIKELVDNKILAVSDEIVNKLAEGINVTVPANGEGKYEFEAIITKIEGEIKNVASVGPQNPENIIDTVNITAEKIASTTEVKVGDSISYTIKLTNSGSEAGDIVVRDDAPDGTEFVSAKLGNTKISEKELTAGYKVTVPANGEKEIILTVKVLGLKNDGTATDSVRNTAYIKDGNEEEDPINSDETKVANIVATKVASSDEISVGKELSYTIRLENKGNADGSKVVKDNVPDGTEFVSATLDNARITEEELANGYKVEVAANSSKEIILTVKVLGLKKDKTATDTLENTAYIKDEDKDEEEPVPSDDVKVANITATKVAASNTISVGEELSYTIKLENKGTADGTKVVRDNVPDGTEFVSATLDNARITEEELANGYTVEVAAKAEKEIILTVKVLGLKNNGSATDSIKNTAYIKDEDGDEEEPVPSDDVNVANIVATKVPSSDEIRVGKEISYTITLTNRGKATGTKIVKDNVPDGTEFVSAKLGNTRITETELANGYAVEVAAKAEKEIILTVKVLGLKSDGTATDTIKNTAYIGEEEEPIPSEDVNVANIVATKVASSEEISVGKQLTYTITLTNRGNADGTKVVRDNVPDGTEFVSATLDNQNITETELADGYTVEVAAKAEKEIKLTVKVLGLKKDGSATDTLENTAYIKDEDGDEEEPVPSDDVKVANITATKVSDYEGKSENKPLYENAEITYTFNMENKGTADGKITISDDVPNGTEFVANSIKVNNADTENVLNDLKTGIEVSVAAGETATLSFKVKVLTFNGDNGDTIKIKNDKAKVVKDEGEEDEPINPTEDIANKVKASLTVTKTWQEPTAVGTTYRPTITISVFNGNTQVGEGKGLTNNSATFDNLNKYAEDGSLIGYTVKETMSSETYYNNTTGEPTVRLENETNNVTITNRFDVTSINDVNVTVTKVWNDADNHEGLRNTVTFTLYADGNATTVTKTAGVNGGEVKFENLQRYNNDEDFSEIVYTVKEESFNPEYYETIYEDNKDYANDGETIVNRLVYNHEDYTDDHVEITKVWDDHNNVDNTRGEGATFTLYKKVNDQRYFMNGKVKAGVVGDNYKVGFWRLARYELDSEGNVVLIEYSVEETLIPENYTVAYANGKTYAFNGETVTNKLNYTTVSGTITVSKTWQEPDDLTGVTRPELTFTLKATGVQDKTATMNNTVSTATFTDVQKYNANGELITYTVTENAHNSVNYLTNTESFNVKAVENENTATFTNRFDVTSINDVNVTVTKVWDDADNDSNTRELVTFKLSNNVGNADVEKTVANTNSGETVTFDGLQRYKDTGTSFELVQYTVSENAFDNDKYYTTEVTYPEGKTYIEGTGDVTVTNTLIFDHDDFMHDTVTVTKAWNDKNNDNETRGTGAELTLYKVSEDGTETQVGDAKWTTEAENVSFTDLPRYENKKPVSYIVKETNYPTNYEPAYVKLADGTDKDYALNGETITNNIDWSGFLTEDDDLVASKIWVDNISQVNRRPSEIILTVVSNKPQIQANTDVTLVPEEGSINTWRMNVEGLRIYDDEGTRLTYELVENNVPNLYDKSESEMTVTNTAKYIITSSVVGGNGTISPDGDTIVVYDGEQKYTFAPKQATTDEPGYTIKSLKIDDVEQTRYNEPRTDLLTDGYTFSNVKKDYTIVVTYGLDENNNDIPDDEEPHYTVEFIAGANGSLSGTTRFTNILINMPFYDMVTVPTVAAGTVIPDAGYHFDDEWEDKDGNPLPAAGSLVTADAEYTAIFRPDTDITYTVKYQKADGTELHRDKVVQNQTMADTVTEEAIPIAGYTPRETQKSLKLQATNNVIIFIYDANTNAAYTTKHYVEKLPGAELDEANGDITVGTKAYELFEAPKVTQATVDTTHSEDSNILDGFTLDPVTTVDYTGNAGLTYEKDGEGNPVLDSEGRLELSGVVKQEFDGENNLVNTLVFNFFYSRNKYTVNYIIVGDKPTTLKEETVPAKETEPTHYYGETITIAPDAEIDGTGYTFSGWKSTLGLFQDGASSFTMPDRDVVLQGRFTPTNNSAEYFMLSYREVISKDTNKPETTTLGSKTFDTYKEIGGKIYELDPEAHALTGKPHAEATMNSSANGTQYVINNDVTKEDTYNTAIRTYDHIEIVDGEEQVTHLSLQNLFKVTRGGETVEDVKATELQDGDVINSIKGTILADQDKELVLVLYYDLVPHTVTYEYRNIPTGYTLEDLPDLPAPSTHRYTEVVTVADKPSLPGYNFDRWYLVSPSLWVGGANGAHTEFNMPDRDVLVYGRFSAKTDAKYTVKHYVEKLAGTPANADDIVGADGKTYELHETELVQNVTVDTTVTDHSKEAVEIAGFTLDTSATINYTGNAGLTYDKDGEGNPVLDSHGRLELSGVVKQDAEGNNLLVFNFFYSRNKYNVSYVLNGYEPTNLTDASKAILNSEPVEYYYEQTVTVEADLETEGPGYIFSHWYSTLGLEITDNANGTRTFTMPHRNVVLHGRFTIDHEHKVDYKVTVYKETLSPDSNSISKTDNNGNVIYYNKTTVIHHAEAQEIVTEQFHDNAYEGYHINVDRTRNAEENTYRHLVEILDDDGNIIEETYVSNDVSHINGTNSDYITGEVFADGTTELAAYYDLNVYNVVYQYEGNTPTGTPTKPETESHKYGEEVTISTQDQTVLGYTFSGWHADNSAAHPVTIANGKFTMPDRNVTIKGNYDPKEVNYYSYHFVEKLAEDTTNYAASDVITINGKTYVKRDAFTRTSTGEVDSLSRVTESLSPVGFTLNVTDTVAYINEFNNNAANAGKEITYTSTDTKVTQQGLITIDSEENGNRAFIYLYNRNKYNLHYYIAGDHVPTNVTGVPADSEHYFEETITVAEPASAEGYVFTQWRKAPTQLEVDIVNGKFTMPARDVKLYGTFNTSNQQVEYNITIYKETLTPDANSITVDNGDGTVTHYNKEVVTPPHKANVYALVEEPFHNDAYVGYHINVERTKAAEENNVLHEETTTTEEGVTTTVYVTNDVSNINGTNSDSIKSRVYADGTTSFAAYYDLNSYSVTYSYTGSVRPDGMPAVPTDTVLHKYGEEVTVSTQDQTVLGYTFSGWHAESGATNPVTITDGKFTMPARNVKLEGSYSANTDTPYQVKHWQQNIDDDEYTLVLTEPKTGTTNAQTSAVAQNYTGFTAKAFSQSTIAPDGSTVVNIYYDRHVWTVTYRYSGTTPDSASPVPAPATYRYGKTVTLADDATAEAGYTFSGWTSDTVTINNRQFTMPDANVTLSGSWIGGLKVTITADYPKTDKKPAAEVGDVITYTFDATEIGNVNYPRTIQIKLDELQRDGETAIVNPFINVVEGNGISYDPETGIITWVITSGTASNLTSTLKVTVNNTFIPGSTITATVISGAIGDPNTVNVEATVQVVGVTDKNIVLVLDVSSSMKLCAKHNSRFAEPSEYNPSGCKECGTKNVSGNRCLIHGRNNMGVYTKNNTNINYCKTCAQDPTVYTSRLAALKVAANTFVESVKQAKGSETVTVTLVTFHSTATTGNTIVLNDSNLGTIEGLINGMTTNTGTNIRAGIQHAITAFNGMSNKQKASNILVFLSDGEPHSDSYMVSNDSTTLQNLRSIPNIERFAIGFGPEFSRTELDAIVDNDTNRVFTADDEDELVEKFEAIAGTINSMQTELGYAGNTLEDVTNIFPVVLSYKAYSNNAQTSITCHNRNQLEDYFVTINDTTKTITWDVAQEQYHGNTDFVIKLGKGAATNEAVSTENGSRTGTLSTKAKNAIINAVQEKEKEVKNVVEATENVAETTENETVETSNVLSTIIEQVETGELNEEKLNSIKNDEISTNKELVDKETTEQEKELVKETKSTEAETENKVEETKFTETETENKVEETQPTETETEVKEDETNTTETEAEVKVEETNTAETETEVKVEETKPAETEAEVNVEEANTAETETEVKTEIKKSGIEETDTSIVEEDMKEVTVNTNIEK